MIILVTAQELQDRMATGPVPAAVTQLQSALMGAHLRVASELDTVFEKASYSEIFQLDATMAPSVRGVFRLRLMNGFVRASPGVTIVAGDALSDMATATEAVTGYKLDAKRGYMMVPDTYEDRYIKVGYDAGFDAADVPANVPDGLREALLAYAPVVMDFSAGAEPAKKNIGKAMETALAHATSVLLPMRRTLGLYHNPVY